MYTCSANVTSVTSKRHKGAAARVREKCDFQQMKEVVKSEVLPTFLNILNCCHVQDIYDSYLSGCPRTKQTYKP